MIDPVELAYRTLDAIEANPDMHVQRTWRCGSGMCFAGWASTLAGLRWVSHDPRDWMSYQQVLFHGAATNVGAAVQEILDLDYQDADMLFESDNTLEDLKEIVAELFGPRMENPYE